MKPWLALLLFVLAGCQPGQPSEQVPPIAELVAANRALTDHLPRPRLRWRVPGAWSHQSIFDVEPDGPVLLALSSTGDRLDVLAIDWQTGAIRWRAPLPHREQPALSAAAGLALAHDINNNLAAFDLKTGRALWDRKLDCEIPPGHLGAAGEGPLLALCERAQRVWAVALDPASGSTRWSQRTQDLLGELYADAKWAYFPQDAMDGGSPRAVVPDLPLLTGPRWRSQWLVADAASGGLEDTLNLPKNQPTSAIGTKWLSAFSRKDAQSLWDVTPFRALHLYRPEEPHPCTYHWPNSGCIPDFLHRVRHAVRDGRWFEIRCDRVVERDPSGAEARSFPIPRFDDLSPSSVAAMEVVGDEIVLLFASYHDALTGRIAVVHPDGRQEVLISPALDTDAVAMHQGLFVVQEGPDLVAYAVLDNRPGTEPVGDLKQVRDLVRGRGQVDARACQKWEFSFDDSATVPLTRIPGWERHLAELFFHPDAKTRDSALAAAVRLKSRLMARVLMTVLAAEAANFDSPRAPRSPRPRYHSSGSSDATYLHSLAVMALVEISYDDAAATLAKHAARTPLPGYDHVARCSSEIMAICQHLNHSDSPQARQAIADYDISAGAAGAFMALCDSPAYRSDVESFP